MNRTRLSTTLALLAVTAAGTPALADRITITGSADFADPVATLAYPANLALIGFSVATDQNGFGVGTVEFEISYDDCFATSTGRLKLTSFDANHDPVDQLALDPYPVTHTAIDDGLFGTLVADLYGAGVHATSGGGSKYMVQLALEDRINHTALGGVSALQYLNDLGRWPYKQIGIGVNTPRVAADQYESTLAADVKSMAAVSVSATCPAPDPDSDGDGLPDSADQCPGSSGGTVNANGCTIAQLVPCAGPKGGGTWKNHGKYVSELVRMAQAFVDAGLISEDQKDAIVAAAASATCGK